MRTLEREKIKWERKRREGEGEGEGEKGGHTSFHKISATFLPSGSGQSKSKVSLSQESRMVLKVGRFAGDWDQQFEIIVLRD
jgi:hypothetical protein